MILEPGYSNFNLRTDKSQTSTFQNYLGPLIVKFHIFNHKILNAKILKSKNFPFTFFDETADYSDSDSYISLKYIHYKRQF